MLKIYNKEFYVFFLEMRRDTGLSACVYLNKIVIKLTVQLGNKDRSAKWYFKVRSLRNLLEANRGHMT